MMPVTRVLCVSIFVVCYHSISAIGIGNTCTNNLDCTAVANAVCRSSVCSCLDDFVPSTSNNICIPSVKHNEDCEESKQCNYSKETECRDSKCGCKTNFKYNGTQCLGSLGLGQECESDSECMDSSDLKHSTVWCYNSQCVCRKGFTREGASCVIGGDCTTDSDCSQLENSFCNTMPRDRYRCACRDNYFAAADNTRCIPNVRHNEICEESRQCTYSEDTECRNNKCQCGNEREYKEGQCVLREVGVGSGCETSEECNEAENTVCREKVCTCISGHVPASSNKNCIPKVDYGAPCSESIQCNFSRQAECVNNICRCKTNFDYNGQLCVGKIPLGQPCGSDSECVVSGDLKQETVWCHGDQCSCRAGYKREGERCVIGGDCETNYECRDLKNSHCNQTVRDRYRCACNETYIPAGNNTKCLPIATHIGSGCEYDEQCSYKLGKAVCERNQCKCAEGTSLKDNTCGAAVRIVLSLSCFVLIWIVKLL